MSGFQTHSGKIAILLQNDIDTDRIIPARFLSMITRSGYGDLLFKDVRGPDFPLDQEEAKGATILVTGSNFGCGSSREHAVWAIQQAGFRCVIARATETTAGYSDIFRQNSGNCGLLLVELNEADHDKLVQLGSGAEIAIDLMNQVITARDWTLSFLINSVTKDALIQGLDLIGTTLQYESAIDAYESSMKTYVPPTAGARP